MKQRTTVALAIAMIIASGPAFAAAAATTAATTATTTTAAAAKTTAMAPAKPKPAAKAHYYVVQAADTKACSVASTKPDGKTATMVGKYWYATAAKAQAALKKAAACKSA